MKNSFNANFYITTATVIPVLYLALTLQGSMFNDLLKRWEENSGPRPDQGRSFRWLLVTTGYSAVAVYTAVFLFGGIFAEFLALKALFYQNAGVASGNFIYVCVTNILIIITAVPLMRFWIVYFKPVSNHRYRKKTKLRDPKSSNPVPSGLGWPPGEVSRSVSVPADIEQQRQTTRSNEQ